MILRPYAFPMPVCTFILVISSFMKSLTIKEFLPCSRNSSILLYTAAVLWFLQYSSALWISFLHSSSPAHRGSIPIAVSPNLVSSTSSGSSTSSTTSSESSSSSKITSPRSIVSNPFKKLFFGDSEDPARSLSAAIAFSCPFPLLKLTASARSSR